MKCSRTARRAAVLLTVAVAVLTGGFASFNAGPAKATGSIVTFSDRTSWNTAVGGTPDFQVDFENFTEDAIFGLSPVDAGPFTLTQIEGIPNLFNRIDVLPYFAVIAPDESPNGSTFAMFVIGNSSIVGNNKVQITFDQPVGAFGADFKSGDGSNFLLNQLVLNTASGPTTTSIDTTSGFFGFTSSESFTSITFQAEPSVPEVAAAFGMDNAVGRFAVQVTTVSVDIKPGSITNPIQLSSKGVVPVGILTTDTFNATTVDPSTVCFGDDDNPSQRDCTAAHGGHVEDVNGDGRPDLLLQYEISDTGIDPGDTSACLTGSTFSGANIEGCDSIKTL